MLERKGRQITIAVTCIGSGVAQSIVNSLRSSSLNTRVVGLGNNMFAFGLYDCDVHDYLPSIYAPDYRTQLLEKCRKHGVQVLLPGLDDDALFLARSAEWFGEHGIEVLVSGPDLVAACRDKVKICNLLHDVTDSFVESFTKDNFREALDSGKLQYPFIAKPLDGSGSQGVQIIHDKDFLHLIEPDSCVQELVAPRCDDPHAEEFWKHVERHTVSQVSEVSVQIVTSREGELVGKMATCNRLKNGVPVEILPFDDVLLWKEVDTLLPVLREMGLRGPINIQGRITESGVRFFELNPRFTGITGLRAMMGFNEVEICLRNWLGLPVQPTLFEANRRKFGLRQVGDKVIPIESEPRVREFCDLLSQGGAKSREVMLLTGATGYLGREIVRRLAELDRWRLWVLSRDKERAGQLLGSSIEACFDYDDLFNGLLPLGNVDLLLHGGFARPRDGNQALAESLFFSSELFRLAGMNNIPSILYISSQTVYGSADSGVWGEDAPVAPASPYASAKYAAELMLQTEKRLQRHLNVTSLRLGTLTGVGEGDVPIGVLTSFVEKALQQAELRVYGGHFCQRLDVRDAADGIVRLLQSPHAKWQAVFNFSHPEQHALEDVARMVWSEVKDITGCDDASITVDHSHGEARAFLDSTRFFDLLGWRPRLTLRDSVQSLIGASRQKSKSL